MTLTVIAVAAPHLIAGALGEGVLKCGDPISLFNACRYAASLASRNVGAWGNSNWQGGRQERRQNMLLMHSLDDDWDNYNELRVFVKSSGQNLA